MENGIFNEVLKFRRKTINFILHSYIIQFCLDRDGNKNSSTSMVVLALPSEVFC